MEKVLRSGFAKMSHKYEVEQAGLKKKIGPLQAEIRKHNRYDEPFAIVHKYTDMQELTPEILAEFVDYIAVHHAENVDREKFQDAATYCNCVAKFVAPSLEELPKPQIRIMIKEECPYRH